MEVCVEMGVEVRVEVGMRGVECRCEGRWVCRGSRIESGMIEFAEVMVRKCHGEVW